jgi:sugar phosphate isomerase/epimerase
MLKQGDCTMIVAASTGSFPHLSFIEAIEKLIDLEFTSVEVLMDDKSSQMPPRRIHEDFQECLRLIRDTHRMDLVAYDLRIDAKDEEHYEIFNSVCKFAKATKVVTLTVPSAELGTPFNQEVEHLQRLVDIAEREGVRVGMLSQIGRLSEDPDTVKVLCDNVHGLGLTLDPSHYLVGPHRNKNLDKLMKYVYHVHLRDSRKDALQVRVGQGEIEYGKWITSLQRVGYDQSLGIDILPDDQVDMQQELRKMRLLLESLL